MIEVIFLIVLAAVWIIFATISDLKSTEIPDWLNISLVIFALGFRFLYSLFSNQGFGFFYQGLIGLGLFFVAGNLLYYSRAFAGGDAKLMVSFGAILPFSYVFLTNVKIFVSFLFLFLFVGAAYGIVTSGYFAIKNFKDFREEFRAGHKRLLKFTIIIMAGALLIMTVGLIFNTLILYLGILVFFLPLLYIYAKAVDESCMKKRISTKKLREGDWLYSDVSAGRKKVKATWDGLSKKDIALLQKSHKEVTIRQGIAFTPVFLISFLFLVYVYFFNSGLWNSFW